MLLLCVYFFMKLRYFSLLHRSYNSLGRICTSNVVNTWYIFTMYSYDGNAEIKYHVGKEAQNFKFHLQIKLRSRNTEYLGSGVKC